MRCHAINATAHIKVLPMCSQKVMGWSSYWWTEASCSHGPLPSRLALSAGLTSVPWSSRTSPSSRATGMLKRFGTPLSRLASSAGSLYCGAGIVWRPSYKATPTLGWFGLGWYPFVRLASSAGSLCCRVALYKVHLATSGTVLHHPGWPCQQG